MNHTKTIICKRCNIQPAEGDPRWTVVVGSLITDVIAPNRGKAIAMVVRRIEAAGGHDEVFENNERRALKARTLAQGVRR